MEEILHQLIGGLVYPIIYRFSAIPGGAGFLPSTVGSSVMPHLQHLLNTLPGLLNGLVIGITLW